MSPETLLSHTDWIRRLAAQLLREDPHGAEDVAQETMLVAWGAISRSEPFSRRWLKGVLKNQVRRFRRVTGRNRSQAELEAQPDPLPGPEEVRRREALRMRVVEVLLALPEPGRQILILHTYEGRKYQEIAERLHMTAANVRKRAELARRQLLAGLRDEEEDGRALLAGLVLLARPETAAAARPALPAAALAAALLVVTGGLAVGLFRGGARGLEPERTEPGLARAADVAGPAAVLAPPGDPAGLGREALTPPTATLPAQPESRPAFPGRAISVRGGVRGPAAGVRVIGEFRREGEVRVSRAISDDAGLLQLENPFPDAAAELDLWAATEDPEEEVVLDPPRLELVPGERHALRIMVYAVDCSLEGSVRDELGRPLEGVLIRSRARSTRTAEDGSFRLRVASGDACLVEALAPGYGVLQRELGSGVSEGVPPLELVLYPERPLRGTVRHLGEPVRDAVVGPLRPASMPPVPSATTDADGRFVLRGLDGRALVLLTVVAPGLPSWGRPIPPGFEGELEVELAVGGDLHGRVVDEDGAPVPLARLRLCDGPPGTLAPDEVRADATGGFSFPRVAEGRWGLLAWRPGFAAASLPEVEVPAQGEVYREVVLPAGKTLEILVLDPEGRPLSDAIATVADHLAGEDDWLPPGDDGRVLLRDLLAGPAVVEVLAPGHLRSEVELQAGPEPFRRASVTLQRSGRIAGRVRDAATGLPVPAFDLCFEPEGAEAFAAQWRPVAHVRGEWDTLRMSLELPPGTPARLEVRAPGYAPRRLEGVAVGTAEEPERLDVWLDPRP